MPERHARCSEGVTHICFACGLIQRAHVYEDISNRQMLTNPPPVHLCSQLIINMEFSLRSLILYAPQRATLIISGDTLVVNTGVVLFRVGHNARRLIESTWRIFPTYRLNDNGAMAIVLAGCTPFDTFERWAACYEQMDRGTHRLVSGDAGALKDLGVSPEWQEQMHLVPLRMINSRFRPSSAGRHLDSYRPGDFILHVAGGLHGKEEALLSALRLVLSMWEAGSLEHSKAQKQVIAIITETLHPKAQWWPWRWLGGGSRVGDDKMQRQKGDLVPSVVPVGLPPPPR